MHYFYSLTLDYTLNYQGKVYFLVVACIKIVRYRIFLFFVAPPFVSETLSHITLRINLQIAHGLCDISFVIAFHLLLFRRRSRQVLAQSSLCQEFPSYRYKRSINCHEQLVISYLSGYVSCFTKLKLQKYYILEKNAFL